MPAAAEKRDPLVNYDDDYGDFDDYDFVFYYYDDSMILIMSMSLVIIMIVIDIYDIVPSILNYFDLLKNTKEKNLLARIERYSRRWTCH